MLRFMRANTLWKKYMPKSNRAPESGLSVVVGLVVVVVARPPCRSVAQPVASLVQHQHTRTHAHGIHVFTLKLSSNLV